MVKIKVDTNIPNIYSTIEATKLLGIGYATLFRWIKSGKIQVIKMNNRTLITKREIERLRGSAVRKRS